MAKVIRYCKLEEEHIGDNCFDISRPNVLGNPYTHIKSKKTLALFVVKTREEAIEKYEAYFEKMLETSEQFRNEWERMYDAYKKFDVIYIGCYCHTNESCHGDILIKKLKQRLLKEAVQKLRKKPSS